MIKSSVFVSLITIILVGANIPVNAWDETGHKITAYIAWQQMRADVRENVIKVLLAAPEDAQLSTFYMPYGSQTEDARKREFFMLTATWADIIKDRNFDNRFKKYNNSNWHYFDTMWTVKDGKVSFVTSTEDLGKLMEKLGDFDRLIRSSASNSDKAIAIAWLEHLIGDLHQPLHTSGRIFGDETKGDQGGNLFALTPKGTTRDKADNLHRFWDSAIGRSFPNSSDMCDSDYLIPIGQTIMKAFPYAKLQSRLAIGKYEVWEKESVDISTTEVYKGVTRYEAPSDEYKKKALSIAEERIALAGYRLGDLFNEVFATPPPPPAVGPPVVKP